MWEFIGGIIFAVVVAFMYERWQDMRQRKRDRAVQATRRAGPYPDHNPDRHEP